MRKERARIILDLRTLGDRLFRFKSTLSRVILLHIASHGGECELRTLMKTVEATPVAIRQHIQSLESEGYITLGTHVSNRRCKIIALTERASELLRDYEDHISDAALKWLAPPYGTSAV